LGDDVAGWFGTRIAQRDRSIRGGAADEIRIHYRTSGREQALREAILDVLAERFGLVTDRFSDLLNQIKEIAALQTLLRRLSLSLPLRSLLSGSPAFR
jgi:hypothetical protein